MRRLNQILDVDLDFYNNDRRPLFSIQRLLGKLNRNIPVGISVEHQDVLPFIRLAVKSKILVTPCEIHHVDEHHDFYGKPDLAHPPGCGDFLYHIPTEWYQRIVWTRNGQSDDADFDWGQRWCQQHNISIHSTFKHLWEPDRVKLALFTISPDYLSNTMLHNAAKMVDMIATHFRSRVTFKPIKEDTDDLRHPKNWEKWLTRSGQRGMMVA